MPHTTERLTGFALLPKNVVVGLTLCVVIATGAAWLDAVEGGNEREDLGSTFDGDPCSQFHLAVEPSSMPGRPRVRKPKDTPECRGKAVFFDETLKGLGANGRACSTCHVARDGFQLTPDHSSARLQALQHARLADPTADDPLFRPIDADDFRLNGDGASDYTTLTQDGLVRITLPLPGNVRPCSPNVVNKIRTYEITFPDGTAIRRSSSDPGRLLLIGDNLDFQKFDVPNLRGIRSTAPYFINNSAKTLEDVLQQYRAFFALQSRIAVTPAAPGFSVISTDGIHRDRPFTPAEEPALLAYLRRQ